MMPDQAKKHYNEFAKEDEAQLLKQKNVVKEDLDDPKAREELVHHQREICRLAAQRMLLCDDDDDDQESARKALREHKEAIKKIVEQEVNRIAELTKNTIKYYQIAGIRWKMLEDITMDNKATELTYSLTDSVLLKIPYAVFELEARALRIKSCIFTPNIPEHRYRRHPKF